MDDPFILNYIDDLLKNIRTQVVIKLIEPYTCIGMPFISKQLNIPAGEVEQLLVSLILDNRIEGHIDQVPPPPPKLSSFVVPCECLRNCWA